MNLPKLQIIMTLLACLMLAVTVRANRELYVKVEPVKQLTDYSCGLAGLSCMRCLAAQKSIFVRR